MSPLALRIIAALLLLTGATDFLSFDRTDLFASMNTQTQSGSRSTPHVRDSRPEGVTPVALPDDGCLFCGVGLPIASLMTQFRPAVSELKASYVLQDLAFSLDSPHPPPKALIA